MFSEGLGFLPQINDVEALQDAILSGDYPERQHYRPYIPRKLQRIINRCMSVNPDERYQNASEFRRQLEAVELKCDWSWRRIRHGVKYETEISNARVTVHVNELDSGRFAIETKRRVQGGSARRVLKDCDVSLPTYKMKARVRRILSRYVTDGR